MLFLAVLECMHSTVLAAELLDVKPIITGNTVSIEISADVAMKYSSYNVPHQAKAILDVAEVDPEKIDPFIVVNKGAVSSISVDKVQVSGIAISRIIFNLVSESEISVSANADRKLLTVTFVGPADAATGSSKPDPVPSTEAAVKVEPHTIIAITPPPAPPDLQSPKLEPVVPLTAAPVHTSALTVKRVAIGASSIDLQTNQPVKNFKVTRMTKPERLVIDIATVNTDQKPKSVHINKFGITRARIGVSPQNIRIVIDSNKHSFPASTITRTNNGLRIKFR
ncbi:MAG: AMIN domain-containing protein [Geobacteraceae bacterium]|nr:AMIN domain-containing protein [Geobacteraceae bacterium]